MTIYTCSSMYIEGKVSKIVNGEYHLVIPRYTLDPSLGFKGAVCRVYDVKKHSHNVYSFRALRREGDDLQYGFMWVKNPTPFFSDSVFDVFPLGTTDQDEADKMGAELYESIVSAYKMGLYCKKGEVV